MQVHIRDPGTLPAWANTPFVSGKNVLFTCFQVVHFGHMSPDGQFSRFYHEEIQVTSQPEDEFEDWTSIYWPVTVAHRVWTCYTLIAN